MHKAKESVTPKISFIMNCARFLVFETDSGCPQIVSEFAVSFVQNPPIDLPMTCPSPR
jgi:hypothetical protein